MIGDGMGPAHLKAASWFQTGTEGGLHLDRMPVRGLVRTSSFTGITDSAAAATTMATGVTTTNRTIGLDRNGAPVQTLVELAREHGLGTGVVTTSSLSHATPGSFTAHVDDRGMKEEIALQQLGAADVMLGGGLDWVDPDFARSQGLNVVFDATELETATLPTLGLFAAEHMDYANERGPSQPTLTEMSLEALDLLDAEHPAGFFLVIEGARIDMASHGNDLDNAIGDTLAFDEAVAAVDDWLASRGGTLLVTADHECGGLALEAPGPVGQLPDHSWRWDIHTNGLVDVFGAGPGTQVLDQQLVDHRSVHAVLHSVLTDTPFAEPAHQLVPDGHLADLRNRVALQTEPTSFGEGYNQLDALWLDSDDHGLAIGVEGAFEFDANNVVFLIDTDHGSGVGHPGLAGSLTDSEGVADRILAAVPLDPPSDPGFAADVAVVASGGQEVWMDDLVSHSGLRGLSNPDDLAWLEAAIVFGEGVREQEPGDQMGLEISIPWTSLYDGAPPAGTTLAIAAVLVNSDGGYLSNQALPPFVDADPTGRDVVPLPGVATYIVP